MTTQELINDWCDLERHIISTFKNASELFRKNTDDAHSLKIKEVRRLCFKLLQIINSEC